MGRLHFAVSAGLFFAGNGCVSDSQQPAVELRDGCYARSALLRTNLM